MRTPPWRRKAVTSITSRGFQTLATVGGWSPWARPERYGLTRHEGLRYGERQEQVADLYVPATPGPWPVALYVHGGGFRALSRRTHWLMALAFARRGYLTYSVDYRLAPEHRFPAAAQDICRALAWIAVHAPEQGGDLGRLVLSGESAGANLALVGTLAACSVRPEPWAAQVRDSGLRPKAVVPFCGLHQVSQPARYDRGFPFQDVIDHTSDCYLGDLVGHALADPLIEVEALDSAQDWPAFFVPCGTADPIHQDSQRLVAALRRLAVDVEGRDYPGEAHSFHGYIWREQARQCWRDTFEFLDARL